MWISRSIRTDASPRWPTPRETPSSSGNIRLSDRKHDGRRAEMAAAGDPSEPVRRSRPYAPGYGIPSHSRGMISWDHVQERMAEARNYWVATVRPDGRPHSHAGVGSLGG